MRMKLLVQREKKMKTNILLVFTMVGILAACSSTPTGVLDLKHIGEEEVLQTYGKADELKKALPFVVDSGTVVATGFVSLPGDGTRPEAGIKMAQMNARAELAKAVQLKIENFAQLSEEGVSADTTQLRGIATEVAKLTANDLRPRKTFYEKVRVISDSGVPRTEYRVWAEITCSEDQFKRHVMDAIRGQNGKASFSKEFAQTVDANWRQVLLGSEQNKDDSAEAEKSTGHKPASVEVQDSE